MIRRGFFFFESVPMLMCLDLRLMIAYTVNHQFIRYSEETLTHSDAVQIHFPKISYEDCKNFDICNKSC